MEEREVDADEKLLTEKGPEISGLLADLLTTGKRGRKLPNNQRGEGTKKSGRV